MTLENIYIKNLLLYTLLIRKLQVQPKNLTLTAALSSIISQLTSTSLAFFATTVREKTGHKWVGIWNLAG